MLFIANQIIIVLLQKTEKETPLPTVMHSWTPLELEVEDEAAPIKIDEVLPSTPKILLQQQLRRCLAP